MLSVWRLSKQKSLIWFQLIITNKLDIWLPNDLKSVEKIITPQIKLFIFWRLAFELVARICSLYWHNILQLLTNFHWKCTYKSIKKTSTLPLDVSCSTFSICIWYLNAYLNTIHEHNSYILYGSSFHFHCHTFEVQSLNTLNKKISR